MPVYSYHYGASKVSAAGVQAISPELSDPRVQEQLRQLSTMHALDSAEHQGEQLSYLLEMYGQELLGVSYPEQPRNSGYHTVAPCGIAYVYDRSKIDRMDERLSSIINFADFSKPGTASPAPLADIPVTECGFYYHHARRVMAELVDTLCMVIAGGQRAAMLVGLPRGKKSDYATARYTMAELVRYIPAPLRGNIRFFTGLPVRDMETDPRLGLGNALWMGANVIFCAAEHLPALQGYPASGVKLSSVNMDAPQGTPGRFASYISGFSDPGAALARVLERVSGTITMDALNIAAQLVQEQGIPKAAGQEQLREMDNKIISLQRQIADLRKENRKL